MHLACKISCAGALLPVSLHSQDHGQGEGGEAEAVAAPRPPGQGAQVIRRPSFWSLYHLEVTREG